MTMTSDSCIYDADISSLELEHDGFRQPYYFEYKRKSFFSINGEVYNTDPFGKFTPEKYYQQQYQLDAFNAYRANPANLYPIHVVMAMKALIPLDECSILKKHPVGIFCDANVVESKTRFKLFCAFGKLYNFVNQSKFKLMIRGGMALRMHLSRKSELLTTAPLTDMDGLVIVDRSVSSERLDEFKTTFMKLLIMTIKNSIDPRDNLVCRAASGDENTTKIMIETTRYGRKASTIELADISFKYSDDEIVKKYDESLPISVQIQPGMLPCTWIYPSMRNLRSEYEYVTANLENQLKQIEEMRENPIPIPSLSEIPDISMENKYMRDLAKFQTKRDITVRGYGGKKKRTIRRKKHIMSKTRRMH